MRRVKVNENFFQKKKELVISRANSDKRVDPESRQFSDHSLTESSKSAPSLAELAHGLISKRKKLEKTNDDIGGLLKKIENVATKPPEEHSPAFYQSLMNIEQSQHNANARGALERVVKILKRHEKEERRELRNRKRLRKSGIESDDGRAVSRGGGGAGDLSGNQGWDGGFTDGSLYEDGEDGNWSDENKHDDALSRRVAHLREHPRRLVPLPPDPRVVGSFYPVDIPNSTGVSGEELEQLRLELYNQHYPVGAEEADPPLRTSLDPPRRHRRKAGLKKWAPIVRDPNDHGSDSSSSGNSQSENLRKIHSDESSLDEEEERRILEKEFQDNRERIEKILDSQHRATTEQRSHLSNLSSWFEKYNPDSASFDQHELAKLTGGGAEGVGDRLGATDSPTSKIEDAVRKLEHGAAELLETSELRRGRMETLDELFRLTFDEIQRFHPSKMKEVAVDFKTLFAEKAILQKKLEDKTAELESVEKASWVNNELVKKKNEMVQALKARVERERKRNAELNQMQRAIRRPGAKKKGDGSSPSTRAAEAGSFVEDNTDSVQEYLETIVELQTEKMSLEKNVARLSMNQKLNELKQRILWKIDPTYMMNHEKKRMMNGMRMAQAKEFGHHTPRELAKEKRRKQREEHMKNIESEVMLLAEQGKATNKVEPAKYHHPKPESNQRPSAPPITKEVAPPENNNSNKPPEPPVAAASRVEDSRPPELTLSTTTTTITPITHAIKETETPKIESPSSPSPHSSSAPSSPLSTGPAGEGLLDSDPMMLIQNMSLGMGFIDNPPPERVVLSLWEQEQVQEEEALPPPSKKQHRGPISFIPPELLTWQPDLAKFGKALEPFFRTLYTRLYFKTKSERLLHEEAHQLHDTLSQAQAALEARASELTTFLWTYEADMSQLGSRLFGPLAEKLSTKICDALNVPHQFIAIEKMVEELLNTHYTGHMSKEYAITQQKPASESDRLAALREKIFGEQMNEKGVTAQGTKGHHGGTADSKTAFIVQQLKDQVSSLKADLKDRDVKLIKTMADMKLMKLKVTMADRNVATKNETMENKVAQHKDELRHLASERTSAINALLSLQRDHDALRLKFESLSNDSEKTRETKAVLERKFEDALSKIEQLELQKRSLSQSLAEAQTAQHELTTGVQSIGTVAQFQDLPRVYMAFHTELVSFVEYVKSEFKVPSSPLPPPAISDKPADLVEYDLALLQSTLLLLQSNQSNPSHLRAEIESLLFQQNSLKSEIEQLRARESARLAEGSGESSSGEKGNESPTLGVATKSEEGASGLSEDIKSRERVRLAESVGSTTISQPLPSEGMKSDKGSSGLSETEVKTIVSDMNKEIQKHQDRVSTLEKDNESLQRKLKEQEALLLDRDNLKEAAQLVAVHQRILSQRAVSNWKSLVAQTRIQKLESMLAQMAADSEATRALLDEKNRKLEQLSKIQSDLQSINTQKDTVVRTMSSMMGNIVQAAAAKQAALQSSSSSPHTKCAASSTTDLQSLSFSPPVRKDSFARRSPPSSSSPFDYPSITRVESFVIAKQPLPQTQLQTQTHTQTQLQPQSKVAELSSSPKVPPREAPLQTGGGSSSSPITKQPSNPDLMMRLDSANPWASDPTVPSPIYGVSRISTAVQEDLHQHHLSPPVVAVASFTTEKEPSLSSSQTSTSVLAAKQPKLPTPFPAPAKPTPAITTSATKSLAPPSKKSEAGGSRRSSYVTATDATPKEDHSSSLLKSRTQTQLGSSGEAPSPLKAPSDFGAANGRVSKLSNHTAPSTSPSPLPPPPPPPPVLQPESDPSVTFSSTASVADSATSSSSPQPKPAPAFASKPEIHAKAATQVNLTLQARGGLPAPIRDPTAPGVLFSTANSSPSPHIPARPAPVVNPPVAFQFPIDGPGSPSKQGASKQRMTNEFDSFGGRSASVLEMGALDGPPPSKVKPPPNYLPPDKAVSPAPKTSSVPNVALASIAVMKEVSRIYGADPLAKQPAPPRTKHDIYDFGAISSMLHENERALESDHAFSDEISQPLRRIKERDRPPLSPTMARVKVGARSHSSLSISTPSIDQLPPIASPDSTRSNAPRAKQFVLPMRSQSTLGFVGGDTTKDLNKNLAALNLEQPGRGFTPTAKKSADSSRSNPERQSRDQKRRASSAQINETMQIPSSSSRFLPSLAK